MFAALRSNQACRCELCLLGVSAAMKRRLIIVRRKKCRLTIRRKKCRLTIRRARKDSACGIAYSDLTDYERRLVASGIEVEHLGGFGADRLS